MENLRVAAARADDAEVGVPAAEAWHGARAFPRADVQLLTQLATAEGLTTAMLHENTGRPLEDVLSSLRNLRRQGYIDSDGSRWSIQQAGHTALELARGEAAHLELDLRTIPGVRVTAYDAGKGYHRIDPRPCPVPFLPLPVNQLVSL